MAKSGRRSSNDGASENNLTVSRQTLPVSSVWNIWTAAFFIGPAAAQPRSLKPARPSQTRAHGRFGRAMAT